MTLQLFIKSACQNVEDFRLDCEWTWTIEQVKTAISEIYPTKPKKDTQKLIYGGKLLLDHLSLNVILDQDQDIHVIHLVYPMPFQSQVEKPKPRRRKILQPTPSSSETSLNPGVLLNSDPSNPYVQYLAMQQAYMQLLTQYMSQYNEPQVAPPQPPPPPPPRLETPPSPRRPQPPPRMEPHLEILDLVNVLIRTLLLGCLLLVYSSPVRVIAVLSAGLLLGWFAKMNRRRSRQEEALRTIERHVNGSPNPGETAGDNSTAPAATEAPVSPYDIFSSTFSLLKSFFTSLVPADPAPVPAN